MRAVARAVEDLLDGQSGLVWFDGEVTGDPNPYVVYYLTTPARRGDRVSSDAPFGMYSLATLYVGSTPNETRWVAEKVHVALEGQLLHVEDREPAPVWLGTAGQVRPDTSRNPPAYVATDVWRFAISRGEPDV